MPTASGVSREGRASRVHVFPAGRAASPPDGPTERYVAKRFAYSSHDRILSILSGELRAGQSVLGLGTAGGILGAALAGRGIELIGIDVDAEAATQARPFYTDVHVLDLTQFPLPYRSRFDWIVAADVIEHLAEPAALLDQCRAALKDGGRLVISVPNVAHLWVRLNLLLGRFPYADRGILDRAHLRFFTWRTLRQLLAAFGLRLEKRYVTPLPMQLALPVTAHPAFRWLHTINYGSARLWKSLLAYQNVVIVSAEH